MILKVTDNLSPIKKKDTEEFNIEDPCDQIEISEIQKKNCQETRVGVINREGDANEIGGLLREFILDDDSLDDLSDNFGNNNMCKFYINSIK